MKKYTDYGLFQNENMEFSIKDVNTPRPWINYLTNGSFVSLISQTGGGYSYYLDATQNRLTRWAPQNYLNDEPGRYLYIYDKTQNDYFQFNGRSALKNKSFKAVHRPGLTSLQGSIKGLKIKMEIFVPLEMNAEMWHITVENTGKEKRDLIIYPFVEWMVGEYFQELHLRNISTLYSVGHFDKSLKSIIVGKQPIANKPWNYLGYMSSTAKINSFEIDYENFIGRYGDYIKPLGLKNRRLTNTNDLVGLNMVGVYQHSCQINPGDRYEFGIVVGIEKNKAEIKKKVSNFNLSSVKKEKKRVLEYWDKAMLDNTIMKTPDKDINQLVNTWLKYEVYICNYVGRSASYYHEGGGEFGYRNTVQDAFGLVPINKEYTKKIIKKLAYHQRQNGECLPGWSLEIGPSTHKPTSDFPAWLPFLVNAYVKETGDTGILNAKVDYFDKGSDSVYHHALKGVRFLQDFAKGKHHLPLMGTQDWNDALDRVGIHGKGESVMLAMQTCWAIQEIKELALFMGDSSIVKECDQRYNHMKKVINKYCWDGDWYIMAYDDNGRPLGIKGDKENKIYLNSQSWAIIAGISDASQNQKMLKMIDKHFNFEYGPPLFVPPYTKYQENVGRITAFAPGTKENAAIFYHAAIFLSYAYTRLGLMDKAYDLIKLLMPNNDRDAEIYKAEPYSMPEYIIGPKNTRYGEGTFTWITGTAPWLYVVLTQHLSGIHPDYNGLRVKAQMPKKWKSINIDRLFRNEMYRFHVEQKKDNIHYTIKKDKRVAKKIIDKGESFMITKKGF